MLQRCTQVQDQARFVVARRLGHDCDEHTATDTVTPLRLDDPPRTRRWRRQARFNRVIYLKLGLNFVFSISDDLRAPS